jgi:hypothetical protein
VRTLHFCLLFAMVFLVGCHRSRPMLCQTCQKRKATVNWNDFDADKNRSEQLWLCQACADSRTPPEVLERIRLARAHGETGAISGWTSYPLKTNDNEKP